MSAPRWYTAIFFLLIATAGTWGCSESNHLVANGDGSATGGRDSGTGGTGSGGSGGAGAAAGSFGSGGLGVGGLGGSPGVGGFLIGGTKGPGGDGGTGTAGAAPGGAAGAVGGGGTGGTDVACGTDGLTCPNDQLCRQATWYPNNVDPNNIRPATVSYSCQPNPCGTAPVSCECGRAACGMYNWTCYALASQRELQCAFQAVCASPETRIATPTGERRIAELSAGDLVYSSDGFALRPFPILRVSKTAVSHHQVVEVRTVDGALLEISAGHPTADGRLFGELRAGDTLDGVLILSSRLIPYLYSHTYDILPASDTGTYVAAGRLIGSTLR